MKKDLLSPDLKVSLPVFAMLFALLVSIYLLYSFGLPTLMSQRDKLTNVNKDRSVLTQKQQILSSVAETVLPQADASIIAVPDQNSTLIVVSQVKNLANQNGVLVTQVNVGAPTTSGDLNSANIDILVDGQRSSILAFVNGLSTLAPLVFLKEMKLSNNNSLFQGNLNLVTYWADLPKNITSLTAPITTLTESESKLLQRFASLSQPAVSQLSPAQPTSRENPFQ